MIAGMSGSMYEAVYSRLVDEEDARVCTEISDDACVEVPGNFLRIVVSQFFSKLGDAVANPKTLLTWLLASVQAPVFFTGLLVPLRESGSLVPQLVIASYVRRQPTRKWLWVFGSIIQAMAVVGMGVVAITMQGATAGWAMITCLVLFSLSRGLCSVAAKDVLGKTIPRTRRGRVNGWSEAVAGLVALALGLFIFNMDPRRSGAEFYGTLVAIAGLLWIFAAFVYSRIREFPGATEGGGNALQEGLSRLDILRTDANFRRFVIARSLLLSSALVTPYIVLLAHEHMGLRAELLGLFIIGNGVAGFISGPIWGRWSDHSSRMVMVVAGSVSCAIGMVIILVQAWVPGWLEQIWLLPLAYFALSTAHNGVRVGRKTYIVDMAGGNRRTDYVAVSNTVIGVVLLLAGAGAAWVASFSLSLVILLFSVLTLLGGLFSYKLPEI